MSLLIDGFDSFVTLCRLCLSIQTEIHSAAKAHSYLVTMACTSVRTLNPPSLGAEEQTAIVPLSSTLKAFIPFCSTFICSIMSNLLICFHITAGERVF